MNRRQALHAFLTSALQAAASVVLASSALGAAPSDDTPAPADGDVKKRADQVTPTTETGDEEFCAFLNGGFRNGGFRNGGFRNGGWRNGGFGNGGFRNGGWHNGGWHNGGFRNFRNF